MEFAPGGQPVGFVDPAALQPEGVVIRSSELESLAILSSAFDDSYLHAVVDSDGAAVWLLDGSY